MEELNDNRPPLKSWDKPVVAVIILTSALTVVVVSRAAIHAVAGLI